MEFQQLQIGTNEKRILYLEQQNRRLKKCGLIGLVVIFSTLVMGQALRISRTVEAEKFVLKDKTGKVRAELAMNDYGKPGLYLYSQDAMDFPLSPDHLYSRPDAVFEMSREDKPRLMLGGLLEPHVVAELTPKGGVFLSLNGAIKGKQGKKGGGSVTFEVEADGAPMLDLTDRDVRRGVRFTFLTDGEPVMGFLDKNRKARTGLTLSKEDTPSLFFQDSDERLRGTVSLDSGGMLTFTSYDTQGNPRQLLSGSGTSDKLTLGDIKGMYGSCLKRKEIDSKLDCSDYARAVESELRTLEIVERLMRR